MRVYNRKAFMELPEGTLYLKGVPWAFDGLSLKHDTLRKDNGEAFDWVYTDLAYIGATDSGELGSRCDEMLEAGASYPLNDSAGRDGFFDDEDIMMVYEKDDLLALRGYIDEALKL